VFNYKLLLEVASKAGEEIMKIYSSNYEISLPEGLINFFYFPCFVVIYSLVGDILYYGGVNLETFGNSNRREMAEF